MTTIVNWDKPVELSADEEKELALFEATIRLDRNKIGERGKVK